MTYMILKSPSDVTNGMFPTIQVLGISGEFCEGLV